MGKKKNNKKTGWVLTFIPIIIALGAFAVSVLSYYDTHIKVNHETQISSLNQYSDIAIGIPIKVPIAIINRGNQSEVIIDVSIMIAFALDSIPKREILNDLQWPGGSQIDSYGKSFVVESGKVKYLELDASSILDEKKGVFPIWLSVDYVDKKGYRSFRSRTIGVLENRDSIQFIYFKERLMNLFSFDKLKPKSISNNK